MSDRFADKEGDARRANRAANNGKGRSSNRRRDDRDDDRDRRDDRDSDIVPEAIKSFVKSLKNAIGRGKKFEVAALYESEFPTLTDRYFKASPWPKVTALSSLMDPEHDALFVCLYRELYFRHIYQKLTPTVQDRQDSFDNYIALFDAINALPTEKPGCDLPAVWLWDITDEFLYQFQDFVAFRSRVANMSQHDVEACQRRPDAWSGQRVVAALHKLAHKGEYDPRATDAQVRDADNARRNGDHDHVHRLFATLAQFALIGLCRLNTLFGNYAMALSVLKGVSSQTGESSAYRLVLPSQSAYYYYMSFSMMMLRRYGDCVKALSSFLTYFSRVNSRGGDKSQYQHQALQRRAEKMYGMLAIATAFYPQRLEEQLFGNVKEKYSLARLQKFDVKAFEDVFHSCCPKFISLHLPALDAAASDTNGNDKRAYRLQLTVFLREIRQRASLPDMYGYLKLCTSITLQKLASFAKAEPDKLMSYLLCLKHKSRLLASEKGGASADRDAWKCTADIDFYIDQQMVHVIEYKPARKYSQYFMRQILKFEDLITDLNSVGTVSSDDNMRR